MAASELGGAAREEEISVCRCSQPSTAQRAAARQGVTARTCSSFTGRKLLLLAAILQLSATLYVVARMGFLLDGNWWPHDLVFTMNRSGRMGYYVLSGLLAWERMELTVHGHVACWHLASK
ncbi:hypothetical protein Dimus_031970 [Dionaea muscipula]